MFPFNICSKVSCTDLAWNGLKPPMSSHKSTPQDHISHEQPYPYPSYLPFSACVACLPEATSNVLSMSACQSTSGAEYPGVPHFVYVLSVFIDLANPKSTSFRSAVSSQTIMFSCFRSLNMIFYLCNVSSITNATAAKYFACSNLIFTLSFWYS